MLPALGWLEQGFRVYSSRRDKGSTSGYLSADRSYWKSVGWDGETWEQHRKKNTTLCWISMMLHISETLQSWKIWVWKVASLRALSTGRPPPRESSRPLACLISVPTSHETQHPKKSYWWPLHTVEISFCFFVTVFSASFFWHPEANLLYMMVLFYAFKC